MPFQAGGWQCHVAGRNDRTGHCQCCKSSGPPLTQSVREAWKAAVKILAYLNSTRDLGITYKKGEELTLSVYTDADYASKETDRRSISGVAVMLGNAAVYATSRTQHCVTLSTTEAEYVALAEGAIRECLLDR